MKSGSKEFVYVKDGWTTFGFCGKIKDDNTECKKPWEYKFIIKDIPYTFSACGEHVILVREYYGDQIERIWSI